jgi:hypothetical protein
MILLFVVYSGIFFIIKGCWFFFFFCSTGVWTQGLHPESLHEPFFCDGFSQDRVSWAICLGWFRTSILLISASWADRITGVSHWSLADVEFLHRLFVNLLRLSRNFCPLFCLCAMLYILIYVCWIIILMGLPIYVTCHFSLEAFNSLSLLYIFRVLTILCLGIFLFWPYMFGVLKASCTWMNLSFSRLGKFSAIICCLCFLYFYFASLLLLVYP